MQDKNDQNKKINFLLYKNKISTNNHKITGIQFSSLDKSMKKNKSNANNMNTIKIKKILFLGDNITKDNNSKKLISNKYSIEDNKNRTLSRCENFNNRCNNIIHSIDYNDIRNNYKNRVNSEFYYNLICLGKKINNNEINKVNSPLVKYFLFNISKSNKKQNLNIAPLYNNYNNNTKKIINYNKINRKPNFSSIEQKLRQKYKNINLKKNINLPKILSHRYSPITLKKKIQNKLNSEDESEENSYSENNQFNSLIEENILKKENDKTNEENNNYIKKNYSLNISTSLFHGNHLRNHKNEFHKFNNNFRIKNLTIKLNSNKSGAFNNLKKIFFK